MIKRLRNDTQTYIPAVVVSEECDKTVCNQYKVWHVTQNNHPVTEKFNRAFQYMKGQNVDAVMITGSDDIFSTRFYEATLAQVNNDIDVVGINSLYFYAGDGQSRGQMVKLVRAPETPLLGTGKTVSKRVLDQCDWRLWNQQRNWGMDAIASKTINQYTKSRVAIDEMLVDVKTRTNLNSFNVWGKRLPQIPAQRFYEILSEEELQILKSL